MTARTVHLMPLLSLANTRGASRAAKRTPTGSGHRILADPVPEECPVDVTGRYQSTAKPGDANGRPLNIQINQAGDHLEFQMFVFPKAAAKEMKLGFGGGEYNYDKKEFDIWFYELEKGHTDLASFRKDAKASNGTISRKSKDELSMTLLKGPQRTLAGGLNRLARIGDGPTPFTQSLPGVYRRAAKLRKHSEWVLASTLWWPLFHFQKVEIEKQAKLLIPRLKKALTNANAEVKEVINNVAQVEIGLIRAMYGHGEIRPQEQVLATRIFLRMFLNELETTIGDKKLSLLVWIDRAIRLGRNRGGTKLTDRMFKHPILGRPVPLFAAEISPDGNGIRNVPEWMRLGVGAEKVVEFEAELISGDVAAGIFIADGNFMGAYLHIKRLTPPKWEGTYGLVAAGLGAGVGSPASVKGSADTGKATSSFDWDPDDIAGVVWIGETGGSAVVSGVGGTMSEEGVTLFGNNPAIPTPLHFDFGDIELTSVDGAVSNTDIEFGYGVGAGTNFCVGLCFTLKELKLRKHMIKLKDVQIENAAGGKNAIGFDFGSALLNGAGRDLVRVLACRELHALMQPRTLLGIVAHADLPDTWKRNVELTHLRAQNTLQAFKDVLGKKLKVDKKHLGITGQGELQAYQDWLSKRIGSGTVAPSTPNPKFRRADITIDGRLTTQLRGAGKPKP